MPVPTYWGVSRRAREDEDEKVLLRRVHSLASHRKTVLAIVALATVAIGSNELGMAYNADERRVYTSDAFQCVATGAVLLVMLEDLPLAWPVLVFAAWMMLKYGRRAARAVRRWR